MRIVRTDRYLQCKMTVLGACLALSTGCFSMPKLVTKTYKNAKLMVEQHVKHPFYFGISTGYGSTNWDALTTPADNGQNPATFSSPIGTSEKHFSYGAFVGYQFSKHFTVESIYVHYPTTRVSFCSDAVCGAFGNVYGLESLDSNTSTYSFLGKILVPFGFTNIYIYADAGVTIVHRKDGKLSVEPGDTINYKKQNRYKAGPSFGFGVAYNITEHLFTEASFQYTTGYGKADIKPAQDYIPFVYSLMFNLGVRV